MPHTVSSIWKNLPENIVSRVENCVNMINSFAIQCKETLVFFRADDVAVPSENFSRLISLFYRYQMPLSLAVVPAWLTRRRWDRLNGLTADTSSLLWCWHQHGWRHVDHSITGKKHEFGQSRSSAHIKNDIEKGMNRLKNIMGERFYPIFTPPWNRCDDTTLRHLKCLRFKAVSRGFENKAENNVGIAEYNIHVDLHTRKEKDPEKGWDNLFLELGQALANGLCGIMIHHQLMNDHAFNFLERLLMILSRQAGIKRVNLRDIAEIYTAERTYA